MSTRYKEPRIVQFFIIGIATIFMGLLVVLPLLTVFYYAFRDGLHVYIASIMDEESLNALKLTLIAGFGALIANTIFGIAVAWAVTKFDFPLKRLFIAIIDMPFTISPVISGLVFVFLFGTDGWFENVDEYIGVRPIFSVLGIVIATTFVTFPFVARSLISLMQTQGSSEEEAAATLGGGFWKILFRITLPNAKWALIYGAVLCFSRAIGDFGAVSVVAGPLRTVTLHLFDLYNEYRMSDAFALASVLTLLSLCSLIIKKIVEKNIVLHDERGK